MRHFPCLLLLLALGICFVSGCGNKESPAPAASDSGFAERLSAATGIMDGTKRDDALAVVASAAATGGDATVVKQSLGRIMDSTKRDAAAEVCALALAKTGKRAEAVEVARTIFEGTRRDATLSKLAKE